MTDWKSQDTGWNPPQMSEVGARGMTASDESYARTVSLHPAARLFLQSELFLILRVIFAGVVTVSIFGYLLGWSSEEIWLSSVKIIGFGFGALTLAELWKLLRVQIRHFYALTEAWAELTTGRDLNRSGAVGDVPIYDLEPQKPTETIRLIPTNQQSKKILGIHDEEIDAADFKEFVLGLTVRGLARRDWVREAKKDGSGGYAYQFQSGTMMTRELYDSLMDVLEHRVKAVKDRRMGTSGTLVKQPIEILGQVGV